MNEYQQTPLYAGAAGILTHLYCESVYVHVFIFIYGNYITLDDSRHASGHFIFPFCFKNTPD